MRRKINVPILKLFLGRLYGTTFFGLGHDMNRAPFPMYYKRNRKKCSRQFRK